MTAALAVAVGAAIYFIYQEIQRQKQQMEAMARHMRKLEALVWTYNIRPRGGEPGHAEISDAATDTEEEEEEEEEEVGEGEYISESSSGDDEEEEQEQQDQVEERPKAAERPGTPPTREFLRQAQAMYPAIAAQRRAAMVAQQQMHAHQPQATPAQLMQQRRQVAQRFGPHPGFMHARQPQHFSQVRQAYQHEQRQHELREQRQHELREQHQHEQHQHELREQHQHELREQHQHELREQHQHELREQHQHELREQHQHEQREQHEQRQHSTTQENQQPANPENDEVPDVVSFDRQRLNTVRDADPINVEVFQEADSASSEGEDDDEARVQEEATPAIDIGEVVESDGEEEDQDENDDVTEIEQDVEEIETGEREFKADNGENARVYADNARNRRLGRVGLPYGAKPESVTTSATT